MSRISSADGGSVVMGRIRSFAVATLLFTGGLVAVIGATGVAQAVTWPCVATAKITSVRDLTADHAGHVIRYGAESPSGAAWSGRTLRHAHMYELHGVSIVVAFGRATYRIDDDAVFALGCSGKAAGDPAKYPDLRMLRGHVVVSDPKGGYSGSASTFEALVSPVNGDSRAVTFSVTRTLTQQTPLTFRQMVEWFGDFIDTPKGKTAAATETRPKINVTPYVGPQPGTCRHCHNSTLTSTGTSGLKPTGTSTYN